MDEFAQRAIVRLRAGLCAVVVLVLVSVLTGCETEVPPEAPPIEQPPPAALPWQAAIGELDTGAPGIHCSAILVRADMVVTASHCLDISTQGPAAPGQLVFRPDMGATTGALPASRGVSVRMGAQIRSGNLRNQDVPVDWALVQISPPLRSVRPIPVASLTIAQMLRRIGSGDRLITAGYGNGASDTLKERDGCRLFSQQELGLYPDDSWLQLDCFIRTGDSGGAIVLLDGGRPLLVGIVVGWGRNPKVIDRTVAFGANAANFAPYVGQPIAAVLLPPADQLAEAPRFHSPRN